MNICNSLDGNIQELYCTLNLQLTKVIAFKKPLFTLQIIQEMEAERIEMTRKSQSFVRFSEPKVSAGISTELPANSSGLFEHHRAFNARPAGLRGDIQGRATTESGIPRPQLRYTARTRLSLDSIIIDGRENWIYESRCNWKKPGTTILCTYGRAAASY